ncbi:cadherin-like domain-containing protein [Pseudopedobacter beijingensis]|uniref:Cadherin-like domain-containing protein n=1 Tax=Pseudopedobacter beijingensis TaxID=1207056 RepID=A0ABW4IB08_9SPHI
MKKFGNNFLKVLVISLIVTLVGCEKFKLLKDEDMDNVSAGANTKNITFTEFLKSNNYQQDDRYSVLKQYAKAVKKAGLEPLLDEADKSFTIVAFTDAAMNLFITTSGYTSIDDVPNEVLKHLILNNIIEDGKFQVIDFAENEDVGFKSLTGDSIFFKREPIASNPYVLKINSVSRYASASATIRSRDLPYKNAIAHVSNTITFTKKSEATIDNPPADLPTSKDTLYVSKDAVLLFAANVSGYSVSNATGPDAFQTKTATPTVTRRLYLQFPIRQPKFTARVGVATLKMFHIRTANGVGESQIDVFADGKTDWFENTTSFADLPIMGPKISEFKIPSSGATNTWFGTTISSPVIDAIESGETFINIGVFNISNSNVYFGHKEYTGNTDKKAFIVLESTPPPVIGNVNVNVVQVNLSDFYKIITKQNISSTGTSDKNIKYIITEVPKYGTVMCNGIPLKKGSVFTQHQLSQNVVKYLCNSEATAGSDEVKIEVQDYTGGYYPDIITLPIQIN